MSRLGWTVLAAVLGVAPLAAGCSDDGPATAGPTKRASSTTSTTSDVPERPPHSTDTTVYDPSTVEGEVEAAYLRSWEVYAEAVWTLEYDQAEFAEVYAGDQLKTKVAELERRQRERRAVRAVVEHDYTVDVVAPTKAVVIDQYVNHMTLVDADTKRDREPDPNELTLISYRLELVSGAWKVTFSERGPA
jgi:hypothetical protein